MPINLPEVTSGYNLSLINDNFNKIESQWDEKLDRIQSQQGNQMEQALDMNDNPILNTKTTSDPKSLVNKEYLDQAIAGIEGAEGVIPLVQTRQQGDGVATIFASPASEQVANSSFIINIDGVTQRPVSDYTANASGDIVFTEAPPLNAAVDITFFEPVNLSDTVSQSYVDSAIANSESNIFSSLKTFLEMSPQSSAPVLGSEVYIVIDDGTDWSGVNPTGSPRPVFYDGSNWIAMF